MKDEESQAGRRLLILGLNDTQRAGSRELNQIEAAFGSIESLRKPSAQLLSQLTGLSASLARALRKEGLEARGERVSADIERYELNAIIVEDDEFPPGLLCLANPPLALFYRGQLPPLTQRKIAIVGSRQCTRYGERMAHALAFDLAVRGIDVVSGAARGVDRAAHEGALEGGGATHGILGLRLAAHLPSEHEKLSRRMTERGALLCEFSPLAPPLPGTFRVEIESLRPCAMPWFWWKRKKKVGD